MCIRDRVKSTGAQIILGNTYHLDLRPGSQLIQELGGLQTYMGWDGPMLTDSGGFQVFSLAQITEVTEQGATFRSHIDGSKVELTPERSVQIQQELGSDIAMVFDHVIALPNETAAIKDAMQRSVRWAERCKDAHTHEQQIQFAIVQGGLDAGLRVSCAEQLIDIDFPGYAIGGLSVGEPPAQMYEMLDVTCPVLPEQKPRYLMGVGRPEDLIEGVRRGVDMFDCVMPTRNGRNDGFYRHWIPQASKRRPRKRSATLAGRRGNGLFPSEQILHPSLVQSQRDDGADFAFASQPRLLSAADDAGSPSDRQRRLHGLLSGANDRLERREVYGLVCHVARQTENAGERLIGWRPMTDLRLV